MIGFMRAWVVRAGSRGEAEQQNLDQNVAAIGWHEIGDLSECASREQVRALVDRAYPSDKPQRRAIFTGQLWAFSHSVEPGDLVILPLKSQTGYVAFGTCTGDYRYNIAEPDAGRRHQIPVQWSAEPVSKSVFKDDLLAMLNAAMTVFSPSKNNAVARLQVVANGHVDPGSANVPPTAETANDGRGGEESVDEVYLTQAVPTLDAIRDRILTHLVENVSQHKLTRLVAAILEAHDFVCEVSPEGPDGGVDIFAGRGPLGLDRPTLIVEVKSQPDPVNVGVLRGLHSAVIKHSATQGLLVAHGGMNGPAKKEFAPLRATIQVWDAQDLLDNLFATYERLPETVRAQIPLKQTWVLDLDAGG